MKFPAPLVRITSAGSTSRRCAITATMSTGDGCAGASRLASHAVRPLARQSLQPPRTGVSAAAKAFGPAWMPSAGW